MKFSDAWEETRPYRIGWVSHYRTRWWRKLKRPWQSESYTERFARRAVTAKGAQRKMQRDLAFRARTGRRSFHQWRRWLVAPSPRSTP